MGLESYGGEVIFGLAVHIQHIPAPNVVQRDRFFGANGAVQLSGGTDGRRFEVQGALFGYNIELLLAAEATLLSFADGIARTLVDPIGRVFSNVVFNGEYVPSPEGPKYTDTGVILPYHAVFHGMT